VAVFAAVIGFSAPAGGSDNTPPLVDSGVDQTVSPGTTVYLDANGTTDPDGTITSVSWTIEQPDGSTQTPTCQSCRTTEFEADTTGEYTVTLEATDNDGATRSDTLYVTVRTEDSPTVSLSGSDRTDKNTDTTVTAEAESGGPSLDMIAWMTDGKMVKKQSLSGTTTEREFTHSFETTGKKQLKAVVYDSLGQRATATHSLTVVKPITHSTGGGGSRCGDAMGMYSDTTFQGCRTGADSVYQADGERVIVDTNNEPGIQVHDGGSLVSYSEDNENLEKRSSGGLRLETDPGQSAKEALKSGEANKNDQSSTSASGSYNNGKQTNDNQVNKNTGSSKSSYSNSSGDNSESQKSGQSTNNNSGGSRNDNSGNDNNGGGFLGGLFGGGSDGDGSDGGDSGGLFGGGNDDSGGNNDDSSGGGLFGGLF
jgi:hypothetical protein